MKYLEDTRPEEMPGHYLTPGSVFSFHCHPGIPCFNQCCRNLNLFLHPYDVLRLGKGLGVGSDRFLSRYVDIVLREGSYFPEVLLKMAEKADRPCIFLSGAGCTVYPDRPHTCRLYPLEQGVSFDAKSGERRLVHFFRPFDFCKGPSETDSWTPERWSDDQGAKTYNEMTVLWSELKRLFRQNPWGKAGLSSPKGKMAFMAAYNLERFRDFVFNSSFLKRYAVSPDAAGRIRNDDVQLLKFAFEWIKYLVWGISGPLFK